MTTIIHPPQTPDINLEDLQLAGPPLVRPYSRIVTYAASHTVVNTVTIVSSPVFRGPIRIVALNLFYSAVGGINDRTHILISRDDTTPAAAFDRDTLLIPAIAVSDGFPGANIPVRHTINQLVSQNLAAVKCRFRNGTTAVLIFHAVIELELP